MSNRSRFQNKFTKRVKEPKAIRVNLTFQESEILAIEKEEDIDKLFEEKSATALSNLKVDLKKFFGFGKEEVPENIISPEELAQQMIDNPKEDISLTTKK